MNPNDPNPPVIEYAPVEPAKKFSFPFKKLMKFAAYAIAAILIIFFGLNHFATRFLGEPAGAGSYILAICIFIALGLSIWMVLAKRRNRKEAADKKPNEPAKEKKPLKTPLEIFGIICVWIFILFVALPYIFTWAFVWWQPRISQHVTIVTPPAKNGGVNYSVLTKTVPIPPIARSAPKPPTKIVPPKPEQTTEVVPPALPPPTPGITPPTLISKVEPEYTEEARRANFSGKVFVDLVIDENGHPMDLKVLNSPGFGLDEKIIAAVEQWRWSPATKDGVDFRIHARVSTNFQRQ